MDQARFQQVKVLVLAVLEQAPEARNDFLETACAGDAALRAEVEALLPHDVAERTDQFLAPLPLPPAAGLSMESSLREGQRVGAYEIEEQIGTGGMGEVYRARRVDDYEQIVAVKLVRRGVVTEETLGRFQNEMQLLAAVGEHPNIARLLDAGTTDDGLPYFVMEYVDGHSIDRHCDLRRLNIRQRLELFGAVCNAVRFAHQHAVIHRDIKPSNILITSDGTPKLIDFGIAKLTTPDAAERSRAFRTAPQSRVLTPHYASPEQMRGEMVSTATDIYSLGVVLYELLSGHRPYELSSDRPIEWAMVVCETNPRKPSTVLHDQELIALGEAANGSSADAVARVRRESPRGLVRALRGDLDNIVLMALRKEVQRRYESVEQFAGDISRHLKQLPVRARRDSFGYRTNRFLRRNRVAASLAFLVLASLVVGIVGTASQAVRARRSAATALKEAERANREAEAAQSVTTFLAEVYESAAPHSLGGFRFGMPRNIAADLQSRRELSAKNTKLIISELSAKPALQARLLEAIANTYVGMGRIDEAAPLLEKSREIVAGDPNAKDLDIARNLRSFAWLRFMQGRYRDAEPVLRKVLAMHRAELGQSDEETLESKLHLAIVLTSLEVRHNAAESLVSDVIDARRKSLGPQHPDVGFALLALSLVRASAQQQQKAIGPALQAARIFATHPETSKLSQGLMGVATSVVQVQLGNKQGAVDLARASLDQIRQLLGDDHPVVAQQSLYVPRLLEEMGEREQAKALYHEAVEQMRNQRKEHSYAYARHLERLGMIAGGTERYDEAETYLREALAIYRRCLRDDSWRVGWTLAQLGIVQRKRGQCEEAIANLDKAMDIFKSVAADSPLDSVEWCQGRIYEAKHQLAATKQ